MSREFRDYYLGVKNCDKCINGERVYFCADCKRFYCAHCLIPHNGKLVCPSGPNHQLLDVIDFGIKLGKMAVDKVRSLGEELERINELLSRFRENAEKVLKVIESRVFLDRASLDLAMSKLADLEEFFNQLGDYINSSQVQLSKNLAMAIRKFGDADIKGALATLEEVKFEELKEGLNLYELEDSFNTLEREVSRAIQELKGGGDLIPKILWENEWLISQVELEDSKKLKKVLVTDKRLLILDERGLFNSIKLSGIDSIEHKERFRFKGLVIKSAEGQIKVPCEKIECYKIRYAIDRARKNEEIARINRELVENINALIESVNVKSQEFLARVEYMEEEIFEFAKRNLDRFLTRFYYTNGGTSNTRGLLDLIKNKRRISRPQHDTPRGPLKKGELDVAPLDHPRSHSNRIIKMVIEKLRSLRTEIEVKLDRGEIDSDIVNLYYQLGKIIEELNGADN